MYLISFWLVACLSCIEINNSITPPPPGVFAPFDVWCYFRRKQITQICLETCFAKKILLLIRQNCFKVNIVIPGSENECFHPALSVSRCNSAFIATVSRIGMDILMTLSWFKHHLIFVIRIRFFYMFLCLWAKYLKKTVDHNVILLAQEWLRK